MGTRTKPGEFDCHRRAADDEPTFTLVARDPQAADLVRRWADERKAAYIEHRGPWNDREERKRIEALACADAMDEWRRRHPRGNQAPPGAES